MSFQPASIKSLLKIKNATAKDDEESDEDAKKLEQLYDALEKNEQPDQQKLLEEIKQGDTQAPPRTPSDLKFRMTGSKFLPNHLDAIIVSNQNSKKLD